MYDTVKTSCFLIRNRLRLRIPFFLRTVVLLYVPPPQNPKKIEGCVAGEERETRTFHLIHKEGVD